MQDKTPSQIIHPLGLAYLEAKASWEAAGAEYIAAIRRQYGPKANAFTQSKDGDGPEVIAARAAWNASAGPLDAARVAMRAAGATVHPINQED